MNGAYKEMEVTATAMPLTRTYVGGGGSEEWASWLPPVGLEVRLVRGLRTKRTKRGINAAR